MLCGAVTPSIDVQSFRRAWSQPGATPSRALEPGFRSQIVVTRGALNHGRRESGTIHATSSRVPKRDGSDAMAPAGRGSRLDRGAVKATLDASKPAHNVHTRISQKR